MLCRLEKNLDKNDVAENNHYAKMKDFQMLMMMDDWWLFHQLINQFHHLNDSEMLMWKVLEMMMNLNNDHSINKDRDLCLRNFTK